MKFKFAEQSGTNEREKQNFRSLQSWELRTDGKAANAIIVMTIYPAAGAARRTGHDLITQALMSFLLQAIIMFVVSRRFNKTDDGVESR